MQMNEQVLTALEVLRNFAENDFERHRIDVLERDFTEPPKAEVIDDKHQKFNDFVFYKDLREHYTLSISIQRFVWQYYYGEIPTDNIYEVHHKNLNPADNDILNFQLLTRAEHQKLHSLLTQPQICVCEVCGKSFSVQNRRHKNSRYCSLTCRNYARWNNPQYKINKKCVVCGKEFTTDKYKNIVCCSVTCRHKLIGEKLKKTPVEKICPVCGKKFVKKGKPNQIYCSRSCAKKN